jgi:hypothetical protein
MLTSKARAYLIGAPSGLQNKDRLLTLPTNIRQVCKCLTVACTLAYYGTELIAAVKSFRVKFVGFHVQLKVFFEASGQTFETIDHIPFFCYLTLTLTD